MTHWYSSLYKTPMFVDMQYTVNRKFGFCVQKDGATNLIENVNNGNLCVNSNGSVNNFSAEASCNLFYKQIECNAKENVNIGFCGEVFDGSTEDKKELIDKYNNTLNKCPSKNPNDYQLKSQSDFDCVQALICLKTILIANTNDWNNAISFNNVSYNFKN